jgi:hypothetical protein
MKQKLTKQFIQKELIFLNGADIKYRLVLCLAVSALLVPFAILCFIGLRNELGTLLLPLLLCGLLLSAPIGLCYLFILSLLERHLLKKGRWEILKCAATYKKEEYRRHRGTLLLLNFKELGQIEVAPTLYEMTTPGDMIYLVRYCYPHSEVKLMYHSATHEYEDSTEEHDE